MFNPSLVTQLMPDANENDIADFMSVLEKVSNFYKNDLKSVENVEATLRACHNAKLNQTNGIQLIGDEASGKLLQNC